MAINSNNVIGDRNPTSFLSSSNASNLSSCRLIKIDFSGRESCSSRKSNKVNNFKDIKSPYLTNDKVHLSRVTEKKPMQKKTTDIVSSYPLAGSVYKSNSDEFKLTKADGKKIKKSVLTLPNEPVRMPTTYTVSDLNDSEYFNDVNDNHNIRKSRKRRSVKRYKKPRGKDPEIEYFDRDARYCSQLNIDLDCSSSEVINLNGNGEGICKSLNKPNNSTNIKNDPNNVWAVLRNINKFKFRPSPPASQESVMPFRKRRPFNKKCNNRNDTRIIETCHTEEFSYISSYEVDNKSQDSCSLSSSFDRVTVINKQSEQDIMKEFTEQIFKSNLNIQRLKNDNINKQTRKKIEPSLINSNKHVLQLKKKKENKQILPNNLQKTVSQKNVSVDKITTFSNDKFVTKQQSTEAKTSVISVTSKNFGSTDKCYHTEKGTLVANEMNKLPLDFCHLKDITKNRSTKLNASKTTDDSVKQLNGITKVVLSKGQDIVSAKLSEPPTKPGVPLILLNNKIPKITQAEIKRRIANLKFPIVILGKDQLTNQGIDVANCDPLHFNGLHENIWPFMLEWFENKRILNIQDGNNNEVLLVKSKNLKVKHRISQGVESSMKYLQKDKNDKKRNVTLNNKNTHEYVPKRSLSKIEKPTPISILKSTMSHFLHKHPYPVNMTENNGNKNKLERKKDKITSTREIANEIELGRSTPIYLPSQHILPQTKRSDETKLFKKSNYSLKHPWAKAKWTSDIIENIIKKVRNGVYYGIDRRDVKNRIVTTEVSTQTELSVIKNASSQNIVNTYIAPEPSENNDPLKSIPGFDKAFSTLEIETFTKSKISIKHCVTNIVLQFDVQVIAGTNNTEHINNSLSCVPVNQKYKQEKIFKCNTSVHNETLPAELCTIIPSMMRNILDANKKLYPPQVTVEKVEETHLTAITEFQGPELELYSTYVFSISNQLRLMLNGHYASRISNNIIIRNKDIWLPVHKINSLTIIFPRVDMSILLHLKPPFIDQNTRILIISEKISKKSIVVKNRISNCMALQPYEPSKLALIPSTGPFNIIKFINRIVNKYALNSNLLESNSYGQVYNGTVDSLLIPTIENQTIMPFNPVNEIVVLSLFKAFIKINHEDDAVLVSNTNSTRSISTGNIEKTHVALDNNKIESKSRADKMKKKQIKAMFNKKSYIKCYRKCNSMSSISAIKSTPLTKITNLDEFCQALGSNSITSVLTGSLEKKILKAINEMKNWIKEISPKQALLVLLLTNKKDTPNINQLRPIILQGIAVNRITKADELDTEIEVIERENFNRQSQYEGITYLPASAENQDNLLEELYWIAKTTASDYKKTFDESSEKFLKSLLEKRKKLNPSYLRVMARYVGLGLLTRAK